MATLIEWYQVTLNFLKDNKVLLLLVTVSLGGNLYQATGKEVTTTPKTVVEQTSCGDCIKQHIKEFH